MNDNFKVKDSDYVLPPADSYFLDLIFIERVPSTNPQWSDTYRWHWRIANVPGQTELFEKGCRASSMTPVTPTLNNKFGAFLKALYGDLNKDQEGKISDLILAKYRVKGFLTHKPQKGTTNIFANIDTLIENTAKKGIGIGVEGASGKLLETVNLWLKLNNIPLVNNTTKSNPVNPTNVNNIPPIVQNTVPKNELDWDNMFNK